jgi:hypothetical protein
MPIVDEPLPRPRRWGAPELARLTEDLELVRFSVVDFSVCLFGFFFVLFSNRSLTPFPR